jgi:hypothetical protein
MTFSALVLVVKRYWIIHTVVVLYEAQTLNECDHFRRTSKGVDARTLQPWTLGAWAATRLYQTRSRDKYPSGVSLFPRIPPSP